MKKIFFLTTLLFLSFQLHAIDPNTQVPYTLADRDRLLGLEKDMQSFRNEMQSFRNEMNSFRNEINTRFENHQKQIEMLQKQIDDVKSLFYWGFGIIITLILFLLGYTVWDRRTALEPLRIQTQTLKEKYHELVLVLKEFSKESPKLAEILKVHGIIL